MVTGTESVNGEWLLTSFEEKKGKQKVCWILNVVSLFLNYWSLFSKKAGFVFCGTPYVFLQWCCYFVHTERSVMSLKVSIQLLITSQREILYRQATIYSNCWSSRSCPWWLRLLEVVIQYIIYTSIFLLYYPGEKYQEYLNRMRKATIWYVAFILSSGRDCYFK